MRPVARAANASRAARAWARRRRAAPATRRARAGARGRLVCGGTRARSRARARRARTRSRARRVSRSRTSRRSFPSRRSARPETRAVVRASGREKRERTRARFRARFRRMTMQASDGGARTGSAHRPRGTSPSSARARAARARRARAVHGDGFERARAARLARGDARRLGPRARSGSRSYARRRRRARSPPDALPLYLPRGVVEARGGDARTCRERARRKGRASEARRAREGDDGWNRGDGRAAAAAACSLAANVVADRTSRTPTPFKTAAVPHRGVPFRFDEGPGRPGRCRQAQGRAPPRVGDAAPARGRRAWSWARAWRRRGATQVGSVRVPGVFSHRGRRAARAARDAERSEMSVRDALTDNARSRSNPFFDVDDDERTPCELSRTESRAGDAGDVRAGDVRAGDVGAGEIRSERPSVFSRSRAFGGNGGFHGKQSLMTSVFGGGGFVGGVRRDVSVSSESPASKNGGVARSRRRRAARRD